MRYIIIPLFIILYSWWSIISIKDLILNRLNRANEATITWIIVNCSLLLTIIIPITFYFCYLYW